MQVTEKEKKKRVDELLAELKELRATPRSDWHTAFEAFLRFSTYKYKGVTIRSEVEIGTDVPRTDYVILTEDEAQDFEESIFKIFKGINILEYKNPHDSLNRRVLHKVVGYASLLIGTAEHEGDVPEEQITISIFRAVKNPGLFKQMEDAGELERSETAGIYYVCKLTNLPFQIVITSELEGDEYAACRALTDKAHEVDIEHVIDGLEKETDDAVKEYYGIFLNLIAEKNPEVFAQIRSDGDMKYPALMKVFEDDVNEKINEKVNERINERVSAKEQEMTIDYIKNMMANLKITVEQAMDALSIPQTQRDTYAGLVKKQVNKI